MAVVDDVTLVRSLARGERFSRSLRVAGPAWIVMLADVDAPSVITAGRAGSDFGYALIGPLLALIPVLYLVQEMTARLGILTRRGHAELIRERYGVGWAAVAISRRSPSTVPGSRRRGRPLGPASQRSRAVWRMLWRPTWTPRAVGANRVAARPRFHPAGGLAPLTR